MTMACAAIIRYFCLVKPSLDRKYEKPKSVARGISLSWLIYSISRAVFLKHGHGYYSERRTLCIYTLDKYASISNYSDSALIVKFSSLIFLAYFKVFRFVSHHNHAVAGNLHQGNDSNTQEAKITKTVAIVVLGFRFCFWWLQ